MPCCSGTWDAAARKQFEEATSGAEKLAQQRALWSERARGHIRQVAKRRGFHRLELYRGISWSFNGEERSVRDLMCRLPHVTSTLVPIGKRFIRSRVAWFIFDILFHHSSHRHYDSIYY